MPKQKRLLRAPVSETVLAVQFRPVQSVSAGHLCQFLSDLGTGWSVPRESTAIGVVSEPISDQEIWLPRLSKIEILPRLPSIRWQSTRDDRMIQVENAWLAMNWKRSSSEDDYTHYSERMQDFEAQMERLQAFLVDRDLGTFDPTMWEIVYVNEIPRGGLWQDASEWADILPSLLSTRGSSSGRLQTVAGHWTWVLHSEIGRLHAEVHHRRRGEDQLLSLKMWARGLVGNDGVRGGLSIGHDALRETFFEIISERAREYWGETT